MDMFLSHSDLVGLTKRHRHSSQAEALNQMGIIHKIRPDGSVAVLRSHIAGQFGEKEQAEVKKQKSPNWEALNRKYGNAAQA